VTIVKRKSKKRALVDDEDEKEPTPKKPLDQHMVDVSEDEASPKVNTMN
jgi:hypothetical protein|tara:strand:+ start:855 stop:1001 length:147 start_codon:yes stop_codon:yes gene_type:complete